mgnify:CR=1 FL=1
MAKKKFYAVKSGVKPGIYETWAECEAQTKGFSGAQFKSFGSMAEAEAYMTGAYIEDKTTDVNNSVDEINNQVEEEISKLTENDVIAFVDGSYSSVAKKFRIWSNYFRRQRNTNTFI